MGGSMRLLDIAVMSARRNIAATAAMAELLRRGQSPDVEIDGRKGAPT
jgi:hypothetical protein